MRSARVSIFSVGARASDGKSGVKLSRQMVWLRTILSQVRRMLQRGQSRQSTEAAGSGASAISEGGEASEDEEESGQSTALTRRGFRVVPLS